MKNLILNPSKSEHPQVGDASNRATYALASLTSPKAKPIQTVRTVRDLVLFLNTGFNADVDIVHASKKARGMLFYLRRSFATLTPITFSHCAKRLFACLFLFRNSQALASIQKLALTFVKGLRHVPYETALQRLWRVSLIRKEFVVKLSVRIK